MRKKGFIFFSFILLFSLMCYAQDVSKELGELNSYLKKRNFYFSSIKGLELVDKLLFFLEKTMLDSIPDLGNYRLISTNSFSRIVMEKGDYEVELYSQKVFSNNLCILTITIDATEDFFEKNYSLYLSYDYLTEKRDFKKLELTNKSEKIPLIIEKDTAVMVYFTTENEPFKGFTVKLDYIFNPAGISRETKWATIMRDITNISSALYKTKLKTFLK